MKKKYEFFFFTKTRAKVDSGTAVGWSVAKFILDGIKR